MKLKALILNILVLSVFSNIKTEVNQDQPNNNIFNQEEKKAKKLNKILDIQLSYLDQISSILQYIADAVNNGKIKIEKRKEFSSWVKFHQDEMAKIEEIKKLTLTQEQLYKMAINIKLLAQHLLQNIENKLKKLENFIPIAQCPIRNIDRDLNLQDLNLKKIKEISDINNNLIRVLQRKTEEASLTTVNKIACKLDLLNDKFQITKILEYTPIIAASAFAGIYFTPKKYLENIWGLSKLKDYIGTSPYTDYKGYTDSFGSQGKEGEAKAEVEKKFIKMKGLYDKLSGLVASKSGITLGAIGAVVTAYATNKQVNQHTSDIRQIIRNYWDKLKGFKVEDSTQRGKVINDLTLYDERLVGLDKDVIQELHNLVKYIVNPEIYDRSNSGLEKGVLLVGQSRNGKTYAAKALCGTLNQEMEKKGYKSRFKFRELKWGEVKWSSEGIKTLIEQAKQDAPCILFIDEIHNLPLQTKEGWSGDTLTEFLTGMSGVNNENDARHQVIILAATNQPELLDFALIQPGRFGTVIHFEKPNYLARKKYFEVMFKYAAVDTSKIDIDSLVRQTNGCSYGSLEAIIKGARFTARTLAKSINQEHLQEEINKRIYNLRSELPLTELEKKYLSVHQAGHALAYMLLDTQEKLEIITIKGRWRKIKEGRFWDYSLRQAMHKAKSTKYGAIFTYSPTELVKIENYDEKIKLCKVKLAGLIAEKIILGSPGYASKTKIKQNTFHNNDKQKAFLYIKNIVFDGIEENSIPKPIRVELEMKAYNMLESLEKETFDLLSSNIAVLEKIAQELSDKATLTATEISQIIKDIK